MKIISLLNPTIKTHGELKALLGDTIVPSGVVPQLDRDTGVISNMPTPQTGVTFLVNFGIFLALKGSRTDLAMFDDKKVIKDPVTGWALTQGGLILSK